jgi:hypothetical protein
MRVPRKLRLDLTLEMNSVASVSVGKFGDLDYNCGRIDRAIYLADFGNQAS